MHKTDAQPTKRQSPRHRAPGTGRARSCVTYPYSRPNPRQPQIPHRPLTAVVTSGPQWSDEARAGGVCLVRLVNILFASTDDLDNHLEGTEGGWPGFFRTLRIYLTHFRGQRSATMQFVTPFPDSEAQAWETLTVALGLNSVSVGQHWTAPAGVPQLGGVAEWVHNDPYDVLLRLDTPGPRRRARCLQRRRPEHGRAEHLTLR